MMSSIRIRIVSFAVLLQFGLIDKVMSTQQYPVFTNAHSSNAKSSNVDSKSAKSKNAKSTNTKSKVSVSTNDGADKPRTELVAKLDQKQQLKRSYQYNGFITVNESRRFFVNAKPLSQNAELKLVSVVNAGRLLVLQHKTLGRIDLHLGQSAGSNK